MTERRTFTDIEIRAADGEKPGVTLQCIKPGVVDDYGSLWKATAFDESLAERMPVLCWAHDWADPLGPAVGFRTTRNGPQVDFHFSDFDAVPQARRAHAQVGDGTIRDCSVGFSNVTRRDPTENERSKHPGVREVIERATLDEVSLVLRGAVPGAKVLAVRSVRTATGAVDGEFIIELGRKIAAGEITPEAAAAAVKLAAGGDPGASEAGEGLGEVPDPATEEQNAELDATIDAALAAVE